MIEIGDGQTTTERRFSNNMCYGDDRSVEVYRFLGKDTIGGQGDIEVTWKWLCKDPKTGKFVTIEECRTWGYCSPDFRKMQRDILAGERFADYFYMKEKETDPVQGEPIAIVHLPVTYNMVREGLFKLDPNPW